MSIIEAAGRNGQIHFDGKTVTIRREGFFGRAGHGRGEKMIPIRQIAGVQMKPSGALTNGFIQLAVPGEISTTKALKGGRTMDAANDENAVIFTKKQQPQFEALRDAIRDAVAAL
ncbi:MAG TPA: DUF4429 domain-containing protein [Microbacterium sp.]|nr:DUF4429 domain-containing protein [Microbacterium sp.]